MKAVSNGKEDVLQIFLDILSEVNTNYCVIGGLAVNAYAEPVVSLDVDIIIESKDISLVCAEVERKFKIEQFTQHINLSSSKSDLRIQLQTDSRYQDFISRAEIRPVLGYDMKVSKVEDVLQGKIWAYSDKQRRKSKRQKDLADIMRLIEAYPLLANTLPGSVRNIVE